MAGRHMCQSRRGIAEKDDLLRDSFRSLHATPPDHSAHGQEKNLEWKSLRHMRLKKKQEALHPSDHRLAALEWNESMCSTRRVQA